MSDVSAPGSPVPSGWLGIARSWLRPGSNRVRTLSEDLPIDAAAPRVHPCGSVRVLVVDDNPANLLTISALMESRGLVPMLAADGAEAVAFARECHFDLILMDLQMPILNGLEATAAIRRREATSSRPAVPVIAYTSASPGAGVLARHGINGSLAKPCNDEDLEDCLVRWCAAYQPWPTLPGARADDGRPPPWAPVAT